MSSGSPAPFPSPVADAAAATPSPPGAAAAERFEVIAIITDGPAEKAFDIAACRVTSASCSEAYYGVEG